MAENKALIKDDEIKSSLISGIFENKPLDAYVLYDKQDDELIFRIAELAVPTTTYFISDSVALLIEIGEKEIVGFRFFDFTNTHLPKFVNLQESWDAEKFSRVFGKFKKIKFESECKQSRKRPVSPGYFRAGKEIECIDQAVSCVI